LAEIHVRRFLPLDLPALQAVEHHYNTEFVWAMDIQETDETIGITFRERKLPRVVRHSYHRDYKGLLSDWKNYWGILVAVLGPTPEKAPVGYTAIYKGSEPHVALVKDLAVANPYRKQGIGTALMLSADDWVLNQGCSRVVVELPSKNVPAIHLMQKLGFEFCGFNDQHFANKDIAVYFGKNLR